VVSSATTPAVLTPRRLVSTTAQIAPSVMATPSVRLPCSDGQSLASEPVSANAITGRDAQIEIQ
jgi:hypothetical protein